MKAKTNASIVSPTVRRLLPSQLHFDVDNIMQPGFYRKIFVVRNLPANITGKNNEFLKDIMQTSNTAISVRVADMAGKHVKTLVDKQFNNSYAGLFHKKRTDSLEAKGDYDDLTEFYMECGRSASRGGGVKYVNIYIETYAPSLEALGKQKESIVNLCESNSVSIEVCTLRQKEGFQGVSPIGQDTQGRLMANNIPSSTFGRLYPFSESSLNDPHGMLLGRTVDKGVILLDFLARDSNRTNTSIAIIGDSGQGKSRLIKKIICQLYIRGIKIFNFDSDNDEYRTETLKLGGTEVNCARGNYVMNPLQVRGFRNENDDDEDWDKDIASFCEKETPFFQHLSWLSDFFKVLIPSISPIQLAALKILVQDVYRKFGIDEGTDFGKLGPNDYPIFTDVYEYIDMVLENRKDYSFYKMIDDSVLKDLLLLLHEVYKGSLSPLFNKHTNIAQGSNLINFNIKELLTGSTDNMQAVLFNYLTYIWSQIIRREGSILLAIDELYLIMNRENPTIAKYLNSFVRRARKYNSILLTGTQKLRDCLDPAIAHLTTAIFDTPTYKFIFYPGTIEFELVKEKLNLSSGEVNSISKFTQRNCLLKVGHDKYHMIVGNLPFEDDLFGTGGGI